jgi:hypothetical protein
VRNPALSGANLSRQAAIWSDLRVSPNARDADAHLFTRAEEIKRTPAGGAGVQLDNGMSSAGPRKTLECDATLTSRFRLGYSFVRPTPTPCATATGDARGWVKSLSLVIAARAGVLLNGLGKRPQMALESGQSLNQCAEGPFGVFRIAAVSLESVDKVLLTFNNATGFGNTTFSRSEAIGGAFDPSHKQFSPDRSRVP